MTTRYLQSEDDEDVLELSKDVEYDSQVSSQAEEQLESPFVSENVKALIQYEHMCEWTWSDLK